MQQLVRNDKLPEGLIVVTDFQTHGKGQRDAHWESEPASNLLFSVLCRPTFLAVNQAFYLTMISALSLLNVIHEEVKKKPLIKWPNDLYVGGKKISGILSESSISNNVLEYVIIGIGLNVNQSAFENVNATSLQLAMGKKFDRFYLLEEWSHYFFSYYQSLQDGSRELIKAEYHDHLMWINETRSFKMADGDVIKGMIMGVTDQGLVEIEENGNTHRFGMKEISFVK